MKNIKEKLGLFLAILLFFVILIFIENLIEKI
jgi:hypothetical protein